ncbi:toxin-like protein 14 [Limulus polyphemus]|uniref:Toxin-like protein 14 n=1 Tax=Limulus polyphemus TaxID=6850 RepID=A0ABM1SJW4_LIMPO|nr:toxin-like protein 14 [Limulus polyphemus]
MKVLMLSLVTLCFFTFVTAYVYIKKVEKKNDGCYDSDFGQIDNQGVIYNDSRCERLDCDANGAEAFIYGAGCGAISVDNPNCKLVPGEGHYPSCCPAPICVSPHKLE